MKKLSKNRGFGWLLGIVIVGALALAGVLGGYVGSKESGQTVVNNLGSTLPQSAPSVFETYLSNQISSTDTSLSLANGNLRDGTALTGYHCFTVDANSPTLEYMCGTASSGTVTGLLRGIDAVSGTSSITALKFAHRRGADIKITDYPILTYLDRMANGVDTYPNPLVYDNIATTTLNSNRNFIPSVGLLQDTAFNGAGIINANTIQKGVVQIGTDLQNASSTATGSSGAVLVIPSSSATSTFNSATAALKVVVTQNNGKIDPNFFTLGTTTNIGSFPAWQIGKQIQVFSTPGTTTFSTPSGITKVHVELVAGGGGGGSCSTGASLVGGGGGGGSGGYSEENVDITGTSTIQLFVGSGGAKDTAGTWSTFGTNGFYLSATGGALGVQITSNASKPNGGVGGVGSGGDINISGGGGGAGSTQNSATPGGGIGGMGGSSRLGGGGAGKTSTAASSGGAGSAAGNYGGGGGGSACSANDGEDGGAGAQGIVIVTW